MMIRAVKIATTLSLIGLDTRQDSCLNLAKLLRGKSIFQIKN